MLMFIDFEFQKNGGAPHKYFTVRIPKSLISGSTALLVVGEVLDLALSSKGRVESDPNGVVIGPFWLFDLGSV